jgi:hypothetical protein
MPAEVLVCTGAEYVVVRIQIAQDNVAIAPGPEKIGQNSPNDAITKNRRRRDFPFIHDICFAPPCSSTTSTP